MNREHLVNQLKSIVHLVNMLTEAEDLDQLEAKIEEIKDICEDSIQYLERE